MNKEEKRNKFYWVLYGYLVFLGVFLIYYQVRVYKLENKLEEFNSELRYDGDEVFKDIGDKFYFYDVEIEKLKERIRELEKESTPEQIIHYEVAFGTFVGVNAYGEEGYCVINIDGKLFETIGNKEYTFIMNERAIVLRINDVYYSIPLRESN